jgi:hypothetical protein
VIPENLSQIFTLKAPTILSGARMVGADGCRLEGDCSRVFRFRMSVMSSLELPR